MNSQTPSFLSRPIVLAVFVVMLAACSSSVIPPGDGGGADSTPRADAVQSDTIARADEGPMFCVFADGRRCNVGTSCPAGDGCNNCTCDSNGRLSCTLLSCAPAACRTTADCGGTGTCIFHTPGCDMAGQCEAPADCPSITYFCGCDGQTHSGPCNGPDAPFLSLGSCVPPVMDAGRPPIDCAPSHVYCGSIAPACGPDEVPQVIEGCWGPCVLFDSCAPIACDPTNPSACPRTAFCDPSTGLCNIGRL